MDTQKTHHNPLGGERHFWVVRLGYPLVKMLQEDYALYYDPAPLARLEHGISQAVARHILTHSKPPNGDAWYLDGLIEAVSGELPPASRRNARRHVRTDSEGLAMLRIVVDGDRVSLLKHPPSSRPSKPVEMHPQSVNA